jgi:energy-coupling factor transporter ATP-binding protein EcfA2
MKLMDVKYQFQNYLSALRENHPQRVPRSEGRAFYVPMNAVHSQGQNFVDPLYSGHGSTKQETQKPILDDLRDLAQRYKHVLLIGKPGMGKSTTLKQLRGEIARQGDLIPILVELRHFSGSLLPDKSLLDELCSQIRWVDKSLQLDPKEMDLYLHSGKFLVLLDGLNELSSDPARDKVGRFIKDYKGCTIVATTRALNLGGTFNIQNQLKMLPLNHGQIKQFVESYFTNSPEQADAMLRELNRQKHEFSREGLGQTPLLLKFLCNEFRQRGAISTDLGTLFRRFVEDYATNPEPHVRKESRQWWQRLLTQLAWEMMHNGQSLVIPKITAHERFEVFFKSRQVENPGDRATECLQDLLKYYLLQYTNEPGKIEFLHPMIQEYYAAAALLNRLPGLTDDQLKQNYLNNLKWTETLALMLPLVNDESLAVKVVGLALEVDLALGVKLEKSVDAKLRNKTMPLIEAKNIPSWLKIDPHRRSRVGPEEYDDFEIDHASLKESVISLFRDIDSEQVIPKLIQGLKVDDSEQQGIAAYALRELSSELITKATPGLLGLLEDKDYSIRGSAVYVLGKYGSEPIAEPERDALVKALEKVLEDDPYPYARGRAAEALGEIGCKSAIPKLLGVLKHKDAWTRRCAANGLGQFKGDLAAYILPEIIPLIPTRFGKEAFRALTAIQGNYKFYNYEIAQHRPEPPLAGDARPTSSINTTNIYGGIFNGPFNVASNYGNQNTAINL